MPVPDESYRTTRQEIQMTDLFGFLLILGAWFALQRFILPKLGVPT
jgi:hypothetical protein